MTETERAQQIDEALKQLPKQLTGKEIIALLLTASNVYASTPFEALKYLTAASLVMSNEMKMPDEALTRLREALKQALTIPEEPTKYIN